MKKSVLISVLILLQITYLFSGNTGKIAGKVTDGQSNELLLGVNIFIKDSRFGAASDVNGNYYILQIPPGKYDLEVDYIGYSKVTVKDVKVQSDLTTIIDFSLKPEALQYGEVIVIAEKKLVQHDVTSTRQTKSREELLEAPGIENSMDMFRLNGGAVLGVAPEPVMLGNGQRLHVRDESLQDIHIRGGRGGEVLYMVDGAPVTHPLYGGRSVVDLNVNEVDEIELLTGGFNAEYGQAQSGVVNITTRSGKKYFEGGVEYKSDKNIPYSSSYNMDYMVWHFAGPLKIKKIIPGELSFFLSGNGTITDTDHENNRERNTLSFMGFDIEERQDNTQSYSGKLDWFSPNYGHHLALSIHESKHDWSRFDWLWKDFPDNTVNYSRVNKHNSLRYTRTLSKSTFFNLNFSYLDVKYEESLLGSNPGDFWIFYKDSTYADELSYNDWMTTYPGIQPYAIESTIQPPRIDDNTGFFDNDGLESIWRNDRTKSYSFRGDFLSQITNRHQIKTGIEMQSHDLSYIDIQDGGVSLSNYGMWYYGVSSFADSTVKPPGPFPELGQNRWVFNVTPTVGGVYLQDKYERESLIINAGVRLDWFSLGDEIFEQSYQKQWTEATGLTPDWKQINFKFSPRFGISFPISEWTVIFFSYGHFTQLPELQYVYRDPYSGGFTGNPGLDYEETVLYEFGFTNQFSKNWAIDVKSYTKDVSNQVGTTQLRSAAGLPVALYDNNGYSRARGLEFKLMKKQDRFSSGNIIYTIQWANGYSSSAFSDYIRSLSNFPNPIRERRLSWDVRHQVILQGSFGIPANSNLSFFGIPLPSNWNTTVLANFSSGYPYTPGSTNLIDLQIKENTSSGPVSFNADLKFSKQFQLGKVRCAFIVDVFNIFSVYNVNLGYGFNTWTGEPFQYGDNIGSKNEMYSWQEMYTFLDPRQFSQPRYIKAGLKIDF